MKMDITPLEREHIIHGLQTRICIVETGDPVMRANDAINSGQPKLVRALSREQRELIASHETLVDKLNALTHQR